MDSAAASSVPPEIESRVREKGDAVAKQAFGVLSSRLGKAIADAGYTNAIQFCSVHGIAITTAVGVTNEVVLRRVSHRPRNPQSRTDPNELALIRKFELDVVRGATPPAVVVADKPGLFTYYAPIVLTLRDMLTNEGNKNHGTDRCHLPAPRSAELHGGGSAAPGHHAVAPCRRGLLFGATVQLEIDDSAPARDARLSSSFAPIVKRAAPR